MPIILDRGIMPHEEWDQMIFQNQVILGNTAGMYGIGDHSARSEAVSLKEQPLLLQGK
jgi:hypothetical protein